MKVGNSHFREWFNFKAGAEGTRYAGISISDDTLFGFAAGDAYLKKRPPLSVTATA